LTFEPSHTSRWSFVVGRRLTSTTEG
jgi:hypothetical protein